MSARYALYYAPRRDDPLMVAASAWLGRDAFTGTPIERPNLDLGDLDVEDLTKDPCHYGFHATLKAPFSLHDDRTETDLMAAINDFCARTRAFEAAIEPQALSAFVAFRLRDGFNEMQALHEACVRQFEDFRAPLSEKDMARRRKANLSAVQDQRLIEFGYPFIFDDFRFHMTLTGAVSDESTRGQIVGALKDYFAPVSAIHRFWGLSLFKQERRDSDFMIIHQCAFAV